MLCKSSEALKAFVEEAKMFAEKGKVADYIPALGKANPNDLSIAIHFPDGNCKSAGDIEKKFTLQSISKVISLALVLMDRGPDYVFERVGMEPTGDPFNSIAKLENTLKLQLQQRLKQELKQEESLRQTRRQRLHL